jgi:hypothetical protein
VQLVIAAGTLGKTLWGATRGRCGCRKSRPRWLSSMIVFVEESAEPIVSADTQTRERRPIG